MQENYEESTLRKKALEDELEDLEGKLLRAEKLLSGESRHLGVIVACFIDQVVTHLRDCLSGQDGTDRAEWPLCEHALPARMSLPLWTVLIPCNAA